MEQLLHSSATETKSLFSSLFSAGDAELIAQNTPPYCKDEWWGITSATSYYSILEMLKVFHKHQHCPMALYNVSVIAHLTMQIIESPKSVPWYKNIIREIVKVRSDEYVFRGNRYRCAFDALRVLTENALESISRSFTPNSYLEYIHKYAEEIDQGLRCELGIYHQLMWNFLRKFNSYSEYYLEVLIELFEAIGIATFHIFDQMGKKEIELEYSKCRLVECIISELGQMPTDKILNACRELPDDIELKSLVMAIEEEFQEVRSRRKYAIKKARPMTERNERWYRMHCDGMSFHQIMREHNENNRSKVNLDLVKKSISRL